MKQAARYQNRQHVSRQNPARVTANERPFEGKPTGHMHKVDTIHPISRGQ